jgi:hypothetical protein
MSPNIVPLTRRNLLQWGVAGLALSKHNLLTTNAKPSSARGFQEDAGDPASIFAKAGLMAREGLFKFSRASREWISLFLSRQGPSFSRSSKWASLRP